MKRKTQQRKPNGQFKKKSKTLNRLGAFILLIMVVSTAFYYKDNVVNTISDKIVYKAEAQTIIIPAEPVDVDGLVAEKMEDKITELENELLNTLSVGCETLDVEDPDGAIIYDSAASNDIRRMSIGRFMFQRRTIKHYVKLRDGRDITNAEAIAIAIDPVESTDLARYVIFERGELKRNWYNCTNKHKLDAQVDFINSLRD